MKRLHAILLGFVLGAFLMALGVSRIVSDTKADRDYWHDLAIAQDSILVAHSMTMEQYQESNR